METTTIEISIENWRWLTNQKRRPGESFNDVLDRIRRQPKSRSLEDTENDARFDPNNEASVIKPAEIPDDLDLPGSGEKYERRREAIARLYAYLREEGTATRADFLQLIDPSDVDYASGASFWSNCIKGRDSLSTLEGVEPPEEGEHTWRFES